MTSPAMQPTSYTTTAPAFGAMSKQERAGLAATRLENARRTGDESAIQKAEAWELFCRKQVEADETGKALATHFASLSLDDYHTFYS